MHPTELPVGVGREVNRRRCHQPRIQSPGRVADQVNGPVVRAGGVCHHLRQLGRSPSNRCRGVDFTDPHFERFAMGPEPLFQSGAYVAEVVVRRQTREAEHPRGEVHACRDHAVAIMAWADGDGAAQTGGPRKPIASTFAEWPVAPHRRNPATLRQVELSSDGAEVEAAINATLSRKGIAANVVINGTTAELHGRGTVVAVDLAEVVKQWPLLPPDIRARKINAAVRRLLSAADGRAAPQGHVAARARKRSVRPLLGVAIAIVLVVAAIHWLRQTNFFGPIEDAVRLPLTEPAGSGSAQPEAADARRARTARVCEAARARIHAGGRMAGLDFDGWEVVLWMARLSPDASWAAELQSSVTEGDRAQQARAAVGIGENSELRVVPDGKSRAVGAVEGSVAFRFAGDFVGAFLEPQGRTRFIDFVEAWAISARAEAAALYGSCAHLDAADIGAWYWGRDDKTAVASLLHGAGLCALPPVVKAAELPGSGATLPRLLELSASLDRDKLDEVLARQGGAMHRASRPGVAAADAAAFPQAGTRIRFPLGGPTRATQASRALLAAAQR